MNLTQVRGNLKFIIPALLAVTVIISIAIFLSIKNQQSEVRPSPSPKKIWPPEVKPEDLPIDIKTIKEKIIASQIENRNGDIILHQPGPYEIIYVPTPQAFFVTIFRDPAESHRKEAQEWFLNLGLKQPDLCNLPVRFILFNRELKNTNPNFNYLPDGC